MSTTTTRLALKKPSGSASPAEAVDVADLNNNADLIDKWMGCILVNDGVTPATGDLFDGALVRERTSGYLWEARKNGGGTFDKYPISYPCSFQGYTTSSAVTSGTPGVFQKTGCAAFDGAGSINTSAANITGGMFVVPMTGLWAWTAHVSIEKHATGSRGVALWLDSSARETQTQQQFLPGVSGYDTRFSLSGTMTFAKNAQIGIGMWQNSGGNLAYSNYLSVSLITPYGPA